MGLSNQEMISKLLDRAAFLDAGLLDPERQERFVSTVLEKSKLLRSVRFVRMNRTTMAIDKRHIGDPITKPASEATGPKKTSKASFSKIQLTAVKCRSDWPITMEVLMDNIEKENFEENLMMDVAKAIANDFERLGLNGDTTVTGDDPVSECLSIVDGWVKLAKSGGQYTAHLVNAGGRTIRKEIFAEMLRRMPKYFRESGDLRWIMSSNVADDWTTYLSDRGDSIGEAAMRGQGIGPYGIPLLRIPLVPDDLPLTETANATPAQIKTVRGGPFQFHTGVDDVLNLNVNSVGAINITFPEGTYETPQVVQLINTAIAGSAFTGQAVALTYGDEEIHIVTTLAGAAQTIVIGADGPPVGTGPSTANGVFGWPVAGVTATGSAALAAGTINEGSYVILTNPMNLVFGFVERPPVEGETRNFGIEGTRMITEYKKDSDMFETTIYNHIAIAIENPNAMVLAENIRRRSLL